MITKELNLEKKEVAIEAAELTVHAGDAIIPQKLLTLGTQGWSIIDVVRLTDGFRLVMVRNQSVLADKTLESFHIGGLRCPRYCDCDYRYGKTMPTLT